MLLGPHLLLRHLHSTGQFGDLSVLLLEQVNRPSLQRIVILKLVLVEFDLSFYGLDLGAEVLMTIRRLKTLFDLGAEPMRAAVA